MKIDVECHVSTPALNAIWDYSAEAARNGPEYMNDVIRRWTDIPLQMESMDAGGIERSVVSLVAGGAQTIADMDKAAGFARETNEYLVEHYSRRYPDRFSVFANIPMQRGDAAARELEYAVTKLGACGCLIRGYTNRGDDLVFLDDQTMVEFWDCVAELDVPVYLHPREPMPGSPRRIYDGHPALVGSAWGFGIDTATFAMRLMMSDVFDRHSGIQVILGHLGEGLPFLLPRSAHRLHKQRNGISMASGKKPLTEYFRNNFYLTTSGHFNTPALQNAITAVGVDRVLFSVDYPFEQIDFAVEWLDSVDMPVADLERIAFGNAKRLFRLV